MTYPEYKEMLETFAKENREKYFPCRTRNIL